MDEGRKTLTATLSQRAREEEADGVLWVAGCLAWVVGVGVGGLSGRGFDGGCGVAGGGVEVGRIGEFARNEGQTGVDGEGRRGAGSRRWRKGRGMEKGRGERGEK